MERGSGESNEDPEWNKSEDAPKQDEDKHGQQQQASNGAVPHRSQASEEEAKPLETGEKRSQVVTAQSQQQGTPQINANDDKHEPQPHQQPEARGHEHDDRLPPNPQRRADPNHYKGNNDDNPHPDPQQPPNPGNRPKSLPPLRNRIPNYWFDEDLDTYEQKTYENALRPDDPHEAISRIRRARLRAKAQVSLEKEIHEAECKADEYGRKMQLRHAHALDLKRKLNAMMYEEEDGY